MAAYRRNDIYIPGLSILIARILPLSPHNMTVERMISAYNKLKDDDRASLSRKTINNYLSIHLNMPPVVEFDMRKPVSKWMEERHRRRRGKDSRKYENNEFFTGFFSSASENKSSKVLSKPEF